MTIAHRLKTSVGVSVPIISSVNAVDNEGITRKMIENVKAISRKAHERGDWCSSEEVKIMLKAAPAVEAAGVV